MSYTKSKPTEISILEIINTLIDSKLIIIVIVSISTFFGFLYNTLKEEYYQTNNFIEISSDSSFTTDKINNLMKDLRVEYYYKQKFNEDYVVFDKIFDNRLLSISYKSPKDTFDSNFLINTLDFVKNWTTDSILLKINSLDNRLMDVNNEIEFIKSSLDNRIIFTKNTLLENNELKKANLSNNIKNIEAQILALKEKFNCCQ